MAQRYMLVASKYETVSHLSSLRNALRLLTEDAKEEEEPEKPQEQTAKLKGQKKPPAPGNSLLPLPMIGEGEGDEEQEPPEPPEKGLTGFITLEQEPATGSTEGNGTFLSYKEPNAPA